MGRSSDFKFSRSGEVNRVRWKLIFLAIIAFCLVLATHYSRSQIFTYDLWEKANPRGNEEGANTFSWTSIEPSQQLRYKPCYDGFQCARLDVPLNWNSSNHSNVPRAAIAVIKLPAKVPVTDARYGGPIVLNPGGPGMSGIDTALRGGKYAQTILDSPDGKFFDIISFDPRGVQHTTPRLKCFPDAFNQQAWMMKVPDYALLWDSDSVLGLEWARSKALGWSCSREAEENDMVRFVNTAQVVEDIVEIIERHGEWRELEAKRILENYSRQIKGSDRVRVSQEIAWRKGSEQLQYWGFSYGTLLGQTFAAMRPDRVHRVVIDGVLDPVDYYTNNWVKNLQDADDIITTFCEDCHSAGPDKCALYTGTSGKDVEARFERIMKDLKTNPISVPGDAQTGRGPEIATFGDIFLRMLSGMYFSFQSAEGFFSLLAEIEKGNATEIAGIKQEWLKAVDIPVDCQRDGPYADSCDVSSTYHPGAGPFMAISCMDSGGHNPITMVEYKDFLKVLMEQSKWIGLSWARNRLDCIGFTVKPAWRFEGPIEGITANPLLIIGNTHDTVTPLRNARHVSTLFPGSAVLHQDSQGHCSISNPSICTAKVLQNYFQTGKLPTEGLVCKPEYKPFIGCLNKDENGQCKELDSEEKVVWEALRGITEVWP